MNEVQKLKVRFRQDPRVDWIYIRFMTGLDSITVRTSSVYSPYRQILRWLEAVAIGVDECGTNFRAEGPDFSLSFCRSSRSNDDGTLKVERQSRPDYCFEAHVERAQLVNAIYRGFERFTESLHYCPERWQEMTVGQWCCHQLRDSCSEGELVDKLLGMPAHEAEKELVRLWPCQYASIEVKQTYEQYIYAPGDEAAAPERSLSSVGSLYVLDGIGRSLAKLDRGQRRERLRVLFKCMANDAWGEPLHKLRSLLVKRYLESEFPKHTCGKVVSMELHRI
jgi:hypothetical protein